MLEKILEEIERLEKIQFSSYTEPLITLKDVKQMILKHMNDDKCGECSRRKWYKKGYEDGKKDNDSWIPCEERLPEVDADTAENWEDDDCSEYNVTIRGASEATALKYAPDGTWFDDNGYVYDVIAWQPLPDVYRPEKGAEE